jgi:hypothetical protein
MAIAHPAGRSNRVRLVRCPACGRDLSQLPVRTSTHIAAHVPEDFGLTPLGEIDPQYLPAGGEA